MKLSAGEWDSRLLTNLARSLSIIAALLLAPIPQQSAHAAWTNFNYIGATSFNHCPPSDPGCIEDYLGNDHLVRAIGAPSCAVLVRNQYVCAFRGFLYEIFNHNQIVGAYFDGTTWTYQFFDEFMRYNPNYLSPLSDPSCAGDESGSVVCVTRGIDNALWAATYSGGYWSQFTKIGGPLLSDPSCAYDGVGKAYGPGSIFCAYVGVDSALYVYRFQGGTWTGPQNLGGLATSRPSCAGNGAGQVVCAVRGTDSALYADRFDGTTWQGFQRLGGLITSDPSCTRNRSGRIFCAAGGGTDRALLVNTLSETTQTWSGFQSLGGTIASNPRCAEDAAGLVVCAVRGTDSMLYVNQFDGTRWLGFQNVGGASFPLLFDPACVSDGINPARCIVSDPSLFETSH